MSRYKPENIPMIKKGIATMSDFDKNWAHPDWKVALTDKSEGLVVWQRITLEGINAVKASAIVERTADQIFKVMGNEKYRKQFDPNFHSQRCMERLAEQTYLIHYKTKRVTVVEPRDFVLIFHVNKTPEGVIYVVSVDSGRSELVPETKGIVRGALPLAGWRLEPLPGDPSRTKCDYLAEIDIKGNIPSWMLKSALKD